jgi:quercetin dioxygenase-like cupin family protein
MEFGNIDKLNANEIKTFSFRGKSFPVKGTTIKWLSQVGEAALPEYGLRFFTIKSGGYIPMHQHDYAQTQIIMSGKLVVAHYNEDLEKIEERELNVGDYFYVKPMEIHDMRNTSTEDASFFCCICVLGD